MKLPYAYRGLAMAAALFLLLPAATWSYALRDTLRTAAECRRLRIGTAEANEESDAARDGEEPFMRGGEAVLSGRLLDYAHEGTAVTGYTPATTLRQGGLELHTAELTLSGTFADLLHVLHRIESDAAACAVRSVVWQTATDRASRSERLTLTIYAEQLVEIEKQ